MNAGSVSLPSASAVTHAAGREGYIPYLLLPGVTSAVVVSGLAKPR